MIDLNKYKQFVEKVTSSESNESAPMIQRLVDLEKQGINMSLLLTGGIGIASEGGEFNEIIKKCTCKLSWLREFSRRNFR